MGLKDLVRETFADEGVMAHSVAEYKPRLGQLEMASAIADAMDGGGALVIEAGTGVGKTFAYLVPALLSGARVLISTATKTLQDQLFGRDLPGLIKVLGLPTRTALLKGRGSYLCLHRLLVARQTLPFSDRTLARSLATVETWAQRTRTGDLSELPGLDDQSPLIPIITSSRDNCLGSVCPHFRDCHLNHARREAMSADVVVINHHLFFADLAIRENGMAELLPTAQTVIFDEAHQLNETGTQFSGQRLSTGQLIDFSRDLLAAGLQSARGMADWQALASEAERAARNLRLVAGKRSDGSRLRWVETVPDTLNALDWDAALDGVRSLCTRVWLALELVRAVSPDLARLSERVSGFRKQLEFFGAPCALGAVRWLDLGVQLSMVESPLDIAAVMRERIVDRTLAGGLSRSWIFTSATLGDATDLRWFTEPCGLEGAQVLRVGSPFDFAEQAGIHIPQYLSVPSDPAHTAQVAEFVGRAAAIIGGRTLVLTTTLRALQTIGAALLRQFGSDESLQVLVQGQCPKRELLERFRHGNQGGSAGCVLIASASFWEGIDVPGDTLQLVVIDKLPFPPPNDPLVEARLKRLRMQGRSTFNDYFIPEAAIALKQGAGRLIRRETDRGILVVCDVRLRQMSYGPRLLAALPPMRRIHSDEALVKALQALTRTATTVLIRP